MNIIKLTKKSNALFFAALLLVGTIAASSPLFMLGAQAEPYYGIDKDTKVVSVSSLKCNNINVNVNGLELNLTSVPFLSGLLGSEAQASDEGYTGANSYGSGERSYGDGKSRSDGDFKFICINNNNNTVVGGNDTDDGVTPPPPPFIPTDCIDCFTPQNEGGQLPPPFVDLLEAFLMNPANTVPIGSDPDVNSIEELCAAIDAAAEPGGTPAVTEQTIRTLLNTVFPGNSSPGQILQVINCLLELDLITETAQ